jgi:hypothetical protein
MMPLPMNFRPKISADMFAETFKLFFVRKCPISKWTVPPQSVERQSIKGQSVKRLSIEFNKSNSPLTDNPSNVECQKCQNSNSNSSYLT